MWWTIGLISWAIWHFYWDIHVPKPTSLSLFRNLHNWIAHRKSAIIITSLSVTLGFFGVFARVFAITTALTSIIIFIILESIWISCIFLKNKITKRSMIKSKGPVAITFIFQLIVGMGAIGFFFSILNYGATELTFIIILLPTALFLLAGYKLSQWINKPRLRRRPT